MIKLSGMPHLGEQFLSKDLCWCSIAKAFARRRVQLVQISMRSASIMDKGSTSLESHFRTLPLVFSTVLFYHGDCGSQNQVWVPMLACR